MMLHIDMRNTNHFMGIVAITVTNTGIVLVTVRFADSLFPVEGLTFRSTEVSLSAVGESESRRSFVGKNRSQGNHLYTKSVIAIG